MGVACSSGAGGEKKLGWLGGDDRARKDLKEKRTIIDLVVKSSPAGSAATVTTCPALSRVNR